MTLTRYKLATRDRTTYNGFKLPADGEWFYPADHTSTPRECSNTVLHHYAHPLLAVLFNPIHAAYADPVLFEIEIDEEIGADGLKGWSRAQRIVREVPLPVLTVEQRVAFAIYCAEPYYTDSVWRKWAADWMSGKDRTAEAEAARAEAEAAAWAARAEAEAAARAEAEAAAWAEAARPDFLAIIQRVINTEETI